MPEYKYKCPKCGSIKDVRHKITESPRIKCNICKKIMRRLILPGIGIIFKTGGFYCKGDNNEKQI